MLQETHSNVEVERVWRAERGNSIFYAHGTTAARGTCILIKNSCTHVLHNVSSDEEGRYLILDITISSERYTLASIYAPNEDHPEFFQNFFVTLSSMEIENILIGGDFNVPLNLSLDKKGGRLDHSHNKARNEINLCMEELNLHDFWREMNPDKQNYTWHKNNPTPVFCRLDYFLASFNLYGNI